MFATLGLRALGMGQAPGNQVDGFVGEIELRIPVLEMQVSLYPEVCSVCYCLLQSVTMFVAAIGLLLAIIGNLCSAYPWTMLSILLALNILAAFNGQKKLSALVYITCMKAMLAV